MEEESQYLCSENFIGMDTDESYRGEESVYKAKLCARLNGLPVLMRFPEQQILTFRATISKHLFRKSPGEGMT
jgi:hypothetical protein